MGSDSQPIHLDNIEVMISSLLSVVQYDMRESAEKDLRALVEMAKQCGPDERDAALEEAAMVADQHFEMAKAMRALEHMRQAGSIADGIRALKNDAPQELREAHPPCTGATEPARASSSQPVSTNPYDDDPAGSFPLPEAGKDSGVLRELVESYHAYESVRHTSVGDTVVSARERFFDALAEAEHALPKSSATEGRSA